MAPVRSTKSYDHHSAGYVRPIPTPDRGDSQIMPHLSNKEAGKLNERHNPHLVYVDIFPGDEKEEMGRGLKALLVLRRVPQLESLRDRKPTDKNFTLIHIVASLHPKPKVTHRHFIIKTIPAYLLDLWQFELQAYAFIYLKQSIPRFSLPISQAVRLSAKDKKKELYRFITTFEEKWPKPNHHKLHMIAPPRAVQAGPQEADYPSDVEMRSQDSESDSDQEIPRNDHEGDYRMHRSRLVKRQDRLEREDRVRIIEAGNEQAGGVIGDAQEAVIRRGAQAGDGVQQRMAVVAIQGVVINNAGREVAPLGEQYHTAGVNNNINQPVASGSGHINIPPTPNTPALSTNQPSIHTHQIASPEGQHRDIDQVPQQPDGQKDVEEEDQEEDEDEYDEEGDEEGEGYQVEVDEEEEINGEDNEQDDIPDEAAEDREREARLAEALHQ